MLELYSRATRMCFDSTNLKGVGAGQKRAELGEQDIRSGKLTPCTPTSPREFKGIMVSISNFNHSSGDHRVIGKSLVQVTLIYSMCDVVNIKLCNFFLKDINTEQLS